MARSARPQHDADGTGKPPASHRWLILVHLLPSQPSNLRVRTWRRLQQLGALAVKQSVYLLPDSPVAREDFEWLKTEIVSAGGEATVFAADNVDTWSDDALVDEFRNARQAGYAELARDVAKALKRVGRETARRPRRPGRSPANPVDGFRQRLSELERTDFFGGAGRDRVVALLAQLDKRTSVPRRAARAQRVERDAATYRKRLWVTRPRPGVDRMASAWLIRRFIDPDARFAFATDAEAVPRGGIAFDMFDAEFSHHGEHCTFETFCRRFGLDDAAVRHLAAVVHDLDFKDKKFGSPEAGAVGQIIHGMQLACDDDDTLLWQGISLFEALYQSAARKTRTKPTKQGQGRRAT